MVFLDLIANLKLYYKNLAANKIAPFYDSVKDGTAEYDGKDLTDKIATKEYPHHNVVAAKEYFLGLQRSHLMRSASPKDYYVFAEKDIPGRESYLDSLKNALNLASEK